MSNALTHQKLAATPIENKLVTGAERDPVTKKWKAKFHVEVWTAGRPPAGYYDTFLTTLFESEALALNAANKAGDAFLLS